MSVRKQKIGFLLTIIVSSLGFNIDKVYCQRCSDDSLFFNEKYKYKFEVSGEYLVPMRFSDKIETVTIHAFFWKSYLKDISLKINVGVSSTYGWGHTNQFRATPDTIYVTENKTSGLGLGPVFQIDYAPVKIKRFYIIVEASGGLILYNHNFPYGGDIYNFMFRTGPSISYKLNNSTLLKVGYRWMHVSNGKGYGKQNPFYEAQGINCGLIFIK